MTVLETGNFKSNPGIAQLSVPPGREFVDKANGPVPAPATDEIGASHVILGCRNPANEELK
jgi:hypothetical protein